MEWLLLEPEGICFKVNKEWLDAYFEKNIKYSILEYNTKRPVYDNFAEWQEDYGYKSNMQIYLAAKEAEKIIAIETV